MGNGVLSKLKSLDASDKDSAAKLKTPTDQASPSIDDHPKTSILIDATEKVTEERSSSSSGSHCFFVTSSTSNSSPQQLHSSPSSMKKLTVALTNVEEEERRDATDLSEFEVLEEQVKREVAADNGGRFHLNNVQTNTRTSVLASKQEQNRRQRIRNLSLGKCAECGLTRAGELVRPGGPIPGLRLNWCGCAGKNHFDPLAAEKRGSKSPRTEGHQQKYSALTFERNDTVIRKGGSFFGSGCFQGKVVFVTGCINSLEQRIIQTLVNEGANVVVHGEVDKFLSNLESLKIDDSRISLFPTTSKLEKENEHNDKIGEDDFTSERRKDWEHILERIFHKFGDSLDIVIHSSGSDDVHRKLKRTNTKEGTLKHHFQCQFEIFALLLELTTPYLAKTNGSIVFLHHAKNKEYLRSFEPITRLPQLAHDLSFREFISSSSSTFCNAYPEGGIRVNAVVVQHNSQHHHKHHRRKKFVEKNQEKRKHQQITMLPQHTIKSSKINENLEKQHLCYSNAKETALNVTLFLVSQDAVSLTGQTLTIEGCGKSNGSDG